MIRTETWALLRSRWMMIVAITLLGSILGSVYVLFSPREYTASTRLLVTTDTSGNGADLVQGGTFSQQQARNYSNVATSEVVLQPVIEALGIEITVNALARQISASIPLNTSIISIEVTDASPTRSAAIANAVATSLANTVTRLVPTEADGGTPVRLQVVQTATPPLRPSSPNAPVAILFGTIAALVAAIALVLVLNRISSRVRSVAEVRQISGTTVLGTVSIEPAAAGRPVLTSQTDRTVRAEEFRQIRTSVHFLQTDSDHKTYVITSSVPREGKSTTSINLALSIAAIGKSVCLVEADLREPSIGGYLDLEGSVGFTTVLAGDVELDDALQPWGPDDLSVLLSGALPPNPSELLSSQKAIDLFARLRERFDVTIIDTPPINPVTDAAIVGHHIGGVIMVVGIGRVKTNELNAAIDALGVSQTPVLGTIVNLAPASRPGAYRDAYGASPAVQVEPASPPSVSTAPKKDRSRSEEEDAASEAANSR
ncbi:polysaccharide biosynthesis tyrosine autokinase [Leifsonia sp. Leaf264]|uniref:polysaccharide biosynthesis tyrosine autokinase n=1 Tax=Leifsonia sp. Leaf264 TaxID=1736314 RepID=UPI00070099D0|nr:polysaccharide biosynthesis tyrosine autokinase [Leifsonia sp. Leaf264]KQO97542.1 hypothetical protein ASF30_14040 [Leifsonia sp. Leaf264]